MEDGELGEREGINVVKGIAGGVNQKHLVSDQFLLLCSCPYGLTTSGMGEG